MTEPDVIDVRSGSEALASSFELMGREEPPMAGCPRCSEPLISTFEFRGAEFYCQCCGAKVGFLSPKRLDWTEALQARHDELKAVYAIERVQRDPVTQKLYGMRWAASFFGRDADELKVIVR